MTRAAAKPQIAIPARVLDAFVDAEWGRFTVGARTWHRRDVKRKLADRGILVAPRKGRAK